MLDLSINDPQEGFTNTQMAVLYLGFFMSFFVLKYNFSEMFQRMGYLKPKSNNLSWNLSSIIFCMVLSYVGLNFVFHDIDTVNYGKFLNVSNTIGMLALAYFSFDLITNDMKIDAMFHHILGILFVFIHIYYQDFTYYFCTGMITEISTIFLSLPAFVSRDGMARKVIMVFFVISFFLSRMILIPYILVMAYLNESGMRLGIISTSFLVLFALNAYWFVFIIKKVRKQFQ